MENVNIDERRSQIVTTRVLIVICCLTGDKWQSKTVSSDF